VFNPRNYGLIYVLNLLFDLLEVSCIGSATASPKITKAAIIAI